MSYSLCHFLLELWMVSHSIWDDLGTGKEHHSGLWWQNLESFVVATSTIIHIIVHVMYHFEIAKAPVHSGLIIYSFSWREPYSFLLSTANQCLGRAPPPMYLWYIHIHRIMLDGFGGKKAAAILRKLRNRKPNRHILGIGVSLDKMMSTTHKLFPHWSHWRIQKLLELEIWLKRG